MRSVGWKRFEELAQVSLGYKSLQNQFYYLNQATIDTYGIEAGCLLPIYQMKHLHSGTFVQTAKTDTFLFNCKADESDLRGTGALRYIRAMGERAAAAKKQSGDIQTIRTVLSAQGGRLWYAPKAQPHLAHIWIRKAFDSRYSPYLFRDSVVVDQRCNYVIPKKGVSWELIAAFMSSSLFSLVLECNGSSSMGAGALEAPTTKLRQFPVIDLKSTRAMERTEMLKLARQLWKSCKPVDWDNPALVCSEQRKLDEYLLRLLGEPVAVDKLYIDLAETCQVRLQHASQKRTGVKKRTATDVQAVAAEIAGRVRKKLESKQFPEGFVEGEKETFRVCIVGHNDLSINFDHFLDEVQLEVSDGSGEPVLKGQYPLAIGETIVQALLTGRRDFMVPANDEDAKQLLNGFHKWFQEIEKLISDGIMRSAVGTGYEEQLRSRIYHLLKFQNEAGKKLLPRHMSLAS